MRSKKLIAVKAMKEKEQDVARSIDHEDWGRWVQEAFAKKWGADELHKRTIVYDELAAGEGLGININANVIKQACAAMRRPTGNASGRWRRRRTPRPAAPGPSPSRSRPRAAGGCGVTPYGAGG